jgi:CHAD domain-containing protein
MGDQDIEKALKRVKSIQDEMTKKMDANTKAMQEDLKKMGDNQAKAEMIARIAASKAENDAWHARMDARRARLEFMHIIILLKLCDY